MSNESELLTGYSRPASDPPSTTGVWRGIVTTVRDNNFDFTVPRLSGALYTYESTATLVSPSNLTVGDEILVTFTEGRNDEIVVLGRMSPEASVEAVENPTTEPIGHVDRTQSRISFDNSTRTFSIRPAGESYEIWCASDKFIKTAEETIQIPDTSGLYYISFDANGTLQYSTQYFVWDQECPTAYVYWNDLTNKAEFFADERHGVTMDWATHEYLHRTRGAAIANGFDASYTLGDGSLDSHAQIDIANGTFFDEDLQVDIEHSVSPEENTWQQDLQGPARIPVFYRFGLTGWHWDEPTDFPVKKDAFNTHPTYNGTIITVGGAFWDAVELDANSYGIQWIVATNQLNYPVLSIMGQQQYANIGQADDASWEDMNLDGLPAVELRVLYKIIFRATGTNTPACRFEGVRDYRGALSNATSTAAAVVDHGNLTGLSDDDHPQYAVAGTTGSIQYNGGGSFAGGSFLAWDSVDAILYGGNEVRAASVAGVDSGIVLGQTFSSSYVGLRTGQMSATSGNEYVIMSDGTNTFVSTGLNGRLYLRPYANDTASQIVVDSNITSLYAQVTYVDGALGVGDSTPSYNLDVNGTARVTGEIRADGNISLRSGNNVRDSIYRVGGIFFTWDSDTYGTNLHHSIRSTDGDTWTDAITINSYGNVRINFDSNGNSTTNTFSIGANTTGSGVGLLTIEENGQTTVRGYLLPYVNNTYILGSTTQTWFQGHIRYLHLRNTDTDGSSMYYSSSGGTGHFYLNASLRYTGYIGTVLNSSTNNDYFANNDSSYGGYGGSWNFKHDTTLSTAAPGNSAVTAGRFYAANTSVGSTSDVRLKKNVADFDNEIGLHILRQLRPRTFEWDYDDPTGLWAHGTQIGLVAQEVDEVFPAWVDYWPDESPRRKSDGEIVERALALGLDQQFQVMVVAAIQNLADRIEALEAK